LGPVVDFNHVILFSANASVISVCRHALEPKYLIQIIDHAALPPFSLENFPCVVLIDTAFGDCTFERKLRKISSCIPPLFLVSFPARRPADASLQRFCIPFPCDLDLLYRLVEQRIASLPDVGLLPDRKLIHRDSDTDVAGFEEIAGKSKEILSVKRQLAAVAPKDLTILLLGESGTGKSLAAELIHKFSHRKNKNYVPVNMASIPDGLAESELFGTVPGAYTGAVKRAGRFAKADGGTLFMDEIAETTVNLQSKLLSVLETGNFCSVGSDTEHHVDLRFICATNTDLLFHLREGKFRGDLYYRIADYTIVMPPLRDRCDDIREISEMIVKDKGKVLSDNAIKMLTQYDWPGNVRQLKSCLRRACILTKSSVIQSENIRF
jgi:transcriptional regulator with GAF, ATPase, and Fis domain